MSGFRFKACRFHLQNIEAYVGRNPSTRIISAFFVSSAMVVVDGKPVRLQLCDMAGQVSCTPPLPEFKYDHKQAYIAQIKPLSFTSFCIFSLFFLLGPDRNGGWLVDQSM